MKLDALRFGVAGGIIWSLAVLLMPLMGLCGGYGSFLVNGIGKLYIGYQPTPVGALIGAVWAFFDMGIFGLVVALVYNKLLDLKK